MSRIVDPPFQSRFQWRCHPLVDSLAREVNDWVLANWTFEHDQDKRRYIGFEISRAACLFIPFAEDNRIIYACKLFTILFLTDDVVENLSIEAGAAYNEGLIKTICGQKPPSTPDERMMNDLWIGMRACDKELADVVMEPTLVAIRAQTSRERLNISTLGDYLAYRQRDVAQAVASSLIRFTMSLNISSKTHASLASIERQCANHIILVNDIYSYAKEVRAAQTLTKHAEGRILCSSVAVVSNETGLSVAGTMKVLWMCVRGWEEEYIHQAESRLRLGLKKGTREEVDVRKYLKALQWQLSGNEEWSRTTKRYNDISLECDFLTDFTAKH